MLDATYNPTLVAISILISVFAGFTALNLAERIREASGTTRAIWLFASAIAMGGGIWSMHFVAMLAYDIGIPVTYRADLTALSLILAIAFTAAGLHAVSTYGTSLRVIACAGVLMGLGVATMHYTGMAAMRTAAVVVYDPLIVAVSVAIAVIASAAALWLSFSLRTFATRFAAAFVMGAAVSGMHYTGMVAVTCLADPGISAEPAQISSHLLAAGITVATVVVLMVTLVSAIVDRRIGHRLSREAERLTQINEELRRVSAETERRRAQIVDLLDNSGQGFLSFGPDLVVGSEHSRACERFFGFSPARRSIDSVLYHDDPENAELVRSVIAETYQETDPVRRDAMLSLLPPRIEIGRTVLNVETKLTIGNRIMMILTDVTEEVELSRQVQEERRNLEMIVASVVDRHEFFQAIEEFRELVDVEWPAVRNAAAPSRADLDSLFRKVHTSKGVLSQFGFPKTTAALDAVEGELSVARTRLAQGVPEDGANTADLAMRRALDAFEAAGLEETFEDDIEVVRDALGASYIDQGGATSLAPDLARSLSSLADRVLTHEPVDWRSEQVTDLLGQVSRLSKVDLQDALRSYDRVIQQVAGRLEKEVEPVQVMGQNVWIDTERFGPFLRTLVHVFRNCVSHGIETPDERVGCGKPPAGRIDCTVRLERGVLHITVEDDGRGIDTTSIPAGPGARPRSPGVPVGPVDENHLDAVFEDGFSTAGDPDDVSGRGVGLSAVRAAVQALDGRCAVSTEVGKGTRFTFEIPVIGLEIMAVAAE